MIEWEVSDVWQKSDQQTDESLADKTDTELLDIETDQKFENTGNMTYFSEFLPLLILCSLTGLHL